MSSKPKVFARCDREPVLDLFYSIFRKLQRKHLHMTTVKVKVFVVSAFFLISKSLKIYFVSVCDRSARVSHSVRVETSKERERQQRQQPQRQVRRDRARISFTILAT